MFCRLYTSSIRVLAIDYISASYKAHEWILPRSRVRFDNKLIGSGFQIMFDVASNLLLATNFPK